METDRLILRERSRKLLEEVFNQPVEQQMDFFGYPTVSQMEIDISKMKNHLAINKDTYMQWDVLVKNSRKTIGSCGFHTWRSEHLRAELGYYLHEEYRGKGFMSEALKIVVPFGFNKMKLNRIEAFISPENFPSKKIITALGFTLEGKLRQHYKVNNDILDSEVYSLLRSEFEN